jgi:signal transduction histidine kinase
MLNFARMKNKQLFLITLFLALSTASSWGRTDVAEQTDTLLARLDDRISECLDDATRLDEGYELIQQALALKGVESAKFYPMMRFHEGTYFMGKGDIARWKENRLQLFQELPFDDWEEMSIIIPQELGVIYRREGKTDSAFYYYNNALDESRRQDNLEWQAAIAANVGILHYNLSHFTEAEYYLQQGLGYVRQVDDPYTELCLLQTLGAAKVALGKLNEAEPLLKEAYTMATEAESPDWQLRCLTTMMPMYDKLGKADSAQVCMEHGNAILPLLPQQGITAVGFVTSRANHYYDTGQWSLAVSDFETIMAHGGGGVKTAAVYEKMARCYAHLGRWQEAYFQMDSARIEADTLASERLTAQMADFNVKYQVMEKDLQIARLRTWRMWIGIAVTLAVLTIAALWVYSRQRRKRHEAQMRIATLEDERRRIAKELHDGLCNDMLALEIRMQCSGKDSFSDQLNTLRQKARHMSHQLMPPEFTHLSLHQLLQHHIDMLCQNTTLRASYQALPADNGLWKQIPAEVSHEVYRIAQEHVANIVKGGTAAKLSVSLQQTAEGHYRLSIVDDGHPSGTSNQAATEGLGHRTQNDRIVSIKAHGSSYQTNGENHFELEFSA